MKRKQLLNSLQYSCLGAMLLGGIIGTMGIIYWNAWLIVGYPIAMLFFVIGLVTDVQERNDYERGDFKQN